MHLCNTQKQITGQIVATTVVIVVIRNEATASSRSFEQVVLAKIASQIGKEMNNIKHSNNSAPTDTSPHPTPSIIQCVVGIAIMAIVFSSTKNDNLQSSRVFHSR